MTPGPWATTLNPKTDGAAGRGLHARLGAAGDGGRRPGRRQVGFLRVSMWLFRV